MSIMSFTLPFLLFVESPEDYESVDTVLTFGTNSAESCVDINIADDSVVEQLELFIVTLERPPDLDDRVSLSLTQGVIVIINDDGESKATFSEAMVRCVYIIE